MLKIILFLIIILLAVFGGYYYYSQNQPKPSLISQNQPNKDIKIGILSLKTLNSHEQSISSMKSELAEIGYSPEYIKEDIKENSAFEGAAKRLVEQQVDVIVANSTPGVKAALKATATLPIVFGGVGDPVLNGIVQSLDSSSNNTTGVSTISTNLTSKRLEFLKTVLPNLKKAYIIHQPGETASDNSLKQLKEEAKKLNVTLVEKPATGSAAFKDLANSLKKTEAEAIMLSASATIWSGADLWIEAQNREKIPFLGTERSMGEKGAVIAYGPDYAVIGKQIAKLVNQVLKGVKPLYLPIQRPDKVELILNQNAASKINFIFSDEIKAKADQIIE